MPFTVVREYKARDCGNLTVTKCLVSSPLSPQEAHGSLFVPFPNPIPMETSYSFHRFSASPNLPAEVRACAQRQGQAALSADQA